MKVAVFTGSDLRNYGGGEKDVVNWVSRLNGELDITVYSPEDTDTSHHRVTKNELQNIKVIWYKGKKIRLLKDILPLQKFDLSGYDKVYSMCQGFLLNRVLEKQSKKFLIGIHTQSTLMKQPIEAHKLWKRLFFKILYPINMHYIKKADEIRIQNKDDERRLHEIGFKGKIWNVPPSMFDTTPEPIESENFYIIWFNRISPEKRPEDILEFAKFLTNIEFHIIGSGPLSYIFKQANLPNLKYLGFVSDQKLSEELQKASLCILTSRGENFGMSAIEAQAHGVLTLAYDVMGLRDYNETVVNPIDIIDKIFVYKNLFEADKKKFMELRNYTRIKTLNRFSNKVVIPQIKEMMSK